MWVQQDDHRITKKDRKNGMTWIRASFLGWARKMTNSLFDLVRQIEYMPKLQVYLAHEIKQRDFHHT